MLIPLELRLLAMCAVLVLCLCVVMFFSRGRLRDFFKRIAPFGIGAGIGGLVVLSADGLIQPLVKIYLRFIEGLLVHIGATKWVDSFQPIRASVVFFGPPFFGMVAGAAVVWLIRRNRNSGDR